MKHIEMYRDNQDFHRRVLAMCMTGQRLQKAFGDLYDRIHWDNTNWRPAWYASGREKPDYDHMTKVLHTVPRFELVLLFGNQAISAYYETVLSMPNGDQKWAQKMLVMSCHHPNARHRTQQDLNNFATKVMEHVLKEEGVI